MLRGMMHLHMQQTYALIGKKHSNPKAKYCYFYFKEIKSIHEIKKLIITPVRDHAYFYNLEILDKNI